MSNATQNENAEVVPMDLCSKPGTVLLYDRTERCTLLSIVGDGSAIVEMEDCTIQDVAVEDLYEPDYDAIDARLERDHLEFLEYAHVDHVFRDARHGGDV